MKWMHDPGLIICQLITWTLLLSVWGVLFWLDFVIFSPSTYMDSISLETDILFLLTSNIGLDIILIGTFFSYFFSSWIVLLAMDATVIEESDNPKLYAMVDRLRTKADLPMPKIAISKLPVPNAFATGRNRRHSVVAVTPSLLSLLNDDELESVLAHELSHIKNYDMMTMTLASLLSVIATCLLIGGITELVEGKKEDIADWIVALLPIPIYIFLFIYTLFLTLLLSRIRELAADRGSALITQNPNAMIRALNKITSGTATMPASESKPSAFSSFLIIPASTGESSLSELISTHPSLGERVRNIERVKAEMIEKGIYVKP